jgi:ribose transport system substrate-binding protein
VNYVVGAFGDIVNGLPGALKDAGLADKVKIVTYTQNPALSAALKAGEIEAVVGFPGAENMWQATDVLLRSFAGQTFEPAWNDLPSWIITADNVPSTTEDYPLVADYQAQYKALWGVK